MCAVVRDDPVGNTESDHNVLEEFLSLGGCDRGDRFGFNPLGEFVDGDEEMCLTTRRSLQGGDHVEAPDYERPSDWDGLQFLCWHVYLPTEKLTSLTFADEVVHICDSSRPEESLPISFADQCSGSGVIPAYSRVNLLEQFSPIVFRYAPHEHTGCASFI